MTIEREQLPELGDWDGPLFGELGVLAADEDGRVQCHVCGKHYAALGRHVVLSHELTPDDYRALFGLRATHGLVGPLYRSVLSRLAKHNPGLTTQWRVQRESGYAALREARRAQPSGQPWRLEAKTDPKNRATFRELAGRAGRRIHELHRAGEWSPPGFPDARASSRKGVERLRELRADPAYRAAIGRKISQSMGGRPRAQMTCVVCGTSFEIEASRVRKGRGKTCGVDCWRENQRRGLRAYNASHPEVRRLQQDARYLQLLAALQRLPAEALDRLTGEERDVLTHYYGLAGNQVASQAEIGRRFGRGPRWVRSALARGVDRLLGHGAEPQPVPSRRGGSGAAPHPPASTRGSGGHPT
jgi:hypothetical protein